MQKTYNEQLHDLFQTRDCLKLLCDKGFHLDDLLIQCENEIEEFVIRPLSDYEKVKKEGRL